MTPSETHRITLAHGEHNARSSLAAAVQALGHDLVAVVETSVDLIDAVRRHGPDLVITSTELHDGSAVDALLRLSTHRPTPAIIVAPPDAVENIQATLRDHVMAYLVEPVDERDLEPAIQLVMVRFGEFQALREEVEDLQAALRARKLIERAKGLLMVQHGLDEEAAFRRLQKMATDRRTKLVEVARAIVSAMEAKSGER